MNMNMNILYKFIYLSIDRKKYNQFPFILML